MLNLYIMIKKFLFLFLIVVCAGIFSKNFGYSHAEAATDKEDCRIRPGGKTCDACVASYCAKD
jgi:hypothetical protein